MSGIDLIDQIKEAMYLIHIEQRLNFKFLILVDLRAYQVGAARDKIKKYSDEKIISL